MVPLISSESATFLISIARCRRTYPGVQPEISKDSGRMVVSRHRRGDFDHFESSNIDVALGNEGKKLSLTGHK